MKRISAVITMAVVLLFTARAQTRQPLYVRTDDTLQTACQHQSAQNDYFVSDGMPSDHRKSASVAAPDDDPDGCCIQWVPGQAKACSENLKQKQCKEDAEAVNASWSWHAGACKQDDCP